MSQHQTKRPAGVRCVYPAGVQPEFPLGCEGLDEGGGDPPGGMTVQDAGVSGCNGTHSLNPETYNGKRWWSYAWAESEGYAVRYDGAGYWCIDTNASVTLYRVSSTDDLPPTSGWSATSPAYAPAPTLAYVYE